MKYFEDMVTAIADGWMIARPIGIGYLMKQKFGREFHWAIVVMSR